MGTTIGKNQAQIAQDISDAYTDAAQQPNADVSSGTVNRDLMDIDALDLAASYQNLEAYRKEASLKNAATSDPVALSRYALNFDVTAVPASKATGVATFQASSAPQSDILIPSGTVVQTAPLLDGTVISYQTTAAATLAATATRNLVNGLYEVDVPVQALLAGTAYQVGVNALVSLPNRISGISSVVNKTAIANAYDGDDNPTLASSVLAKTAGTKLGTGKGYADLVLKNFPLVSAVLLVGPTDPDNKRAQYGNEVDVPLVTVQAASFTEIVATTGAQTTKLLASRPVVTVSTVVGTTNGVAYAVGSDWGFQQDTGPVYGYSVLSFDALCWFPGRSPGPGVQLTVQGTRDQAVADVQDFLNDPTRSYITGAMLAKTAQMVSVDVSVSVSASSGQDRSALSSAVAAAISAALSGYGLGQDVSQDDLAVAINAVDGVYSVALPFDALRRSTDIASSDTVAITKREYARAGTVTVSVN